MDFVYVEIDVKFFSLKKSKDWNIFRPNCLQRASVEIVDTHFLYVSVLSGISTGFNVASHNY